ncbi:transposase [Methylocystis sp. IM4]
MEDENNWFAGVDWASQTHHVRLSDPKGAKIGEHTFAHGGEGLKEMADWILKSADAAPERGFQVYAINPKQLDRFRDRFSPAGAKDDSRDAEALADALRTDRRSFRLLAPLDPVLREWPRVAGDLRVERNRLSNRVRELLWRYYPQFLELSDDVTADWMLELWRLAPTPVKAKRVREASVEGLVKRYRLRRITAAEVLERLKANFSLPVEQRAPQRPSRRRRSPRRAGQPPDQRDQ